MILGGSIGGFILAILALLLGVFLVGCGVNVCWLRWRRRVETKAPLESAPRASCPNEPELNKVVVFVKAPVPGKVKTRLCPPLTPDQAASLYSGFAQDTVALVREIVGPGQIAIAYDSLGGPADPRWLKADGGFEHFPQDGGDLGARLNRAFEIGFSSGARKVVVIGSDAPHLEPAELARALDGLSRKDVILGPAVDGGYYLVGLNKPAPELFSGIPWSTAEVLATTLVRAEKHGLSVGMLDLTFDVDAPADLSSLRRTLERLPSNRLPHTRRILDELSIAR